MKVRASCVALVRSTTIRDKTGQCHMRVVIEYGGGNKPECMRECSLLSIGERGWVGVGEGKDSRMCASS